MSTTPTQNFGDFPRNDLHFAPMVATLSSQCRFSPPPSPPDFADFIEVHPDQQTKAPAAAEIEHLRQASKAGSLHDVHEILSKYILSQQPDIVTGRLKLYVFYESVREAIACKHANVLSYLFFMRIGEPSIYIDAALKARSIDIFQVFLDYGWNLNEPIERTKPPALGYITNDRALTEWFLDHGADINAPCAWDFTPMSEAMYIAPLEMIELLFSRGGDIKKGQLLHNAVLRSANDAIKLVGMLLQMGASINDIQYYNHIPTFQERYDFALGTPLHYAAEEGKLEMAAYLLKKGADPFIKNTRGRTVFETAESSGQSEVLKVLWESASVTSFISEDTLPSE